MGPHLLEGVDAPVAGGDELRDAQAVPIQDLETRLHGDLELCQFAGEQLALDGLQLVDHLLAGQKQSSNSHMASCSVDTTWQQHMLLMTTTQQTYTLTRALDGLQLVDRLLAGQKK